MPFNSIRYLLFFVSLAVFFFYMPQRYRWAFLLLGSVFFYLYSSPNVSHLFFIFGLIGINYWFGLKLGEEKAPDKRKRFLFCALTLNIGTLAVFKYLNFFMQIISAAGSSIGINSQPRRIGILVPLGVSFIVFKVISYIMDVYRSKIVPEKHLGYFSLYTIFFPQVMAGPIDRAGDILPQFRQKSGFDYIRFEAGVKLFVWGLFKKAVIADRLAIYVNPIYDHPQDYAGLSLLIATYFYAFEIYCDFSGYTDMAIGCGRILGYDFHINFDRPYFATSIREFWKRWHITFSNWLRDYLYIPLGGNQGSTVRYYFNLVLVFLLCGLWHGASWTFVMWGTLHGVYLVISSATREARNRLIKLFSMGEKSMKFIRVVMTFHLVCFAWIFFRANSLADAYFISKKVLWPTLDLEWLRSRIGEVDFRISLLAIAFLVMVELVQRSTTVLDLTERLPWVPRVALYYGILFAIFFLGVYEKQKFIYLQF